MLGSFFSVFGIIFWVVVLGGGYYLWFRFKKRANGLTNVRDSSGREVTQTRLAKTQLGNLPTDISLIAGVGKNAAPQQSLNETVLHPTIGLRLISLGVSGTLLWMVWLNGADYVPDAPYLKEVVSAVVAYSLLYTNLYELRYDQHGVIHKDWFFREVDFAWRDIVSLRDNGHYAYIVRTADGKKVEVLKYLIGIRPFLTYAHAQIEKNSES
ncbi:hypothetical protein [Yoonia sp. I 8.24]|uniref:hypothetical protein n=1 Tax=Yoonia sp. I 8.24 TaxID=1537229 RepID=UPI001EDCFCA7|nr:hypothetical protein [Yoonia sp. I 8.24]MCG3269124.1 hypothetical protein [Yoonia sp. I 8.24]